MRDTRIFSVNSRIRVLEGQQQLYYYSTIQEAGEYGFFISEPLSTARDKLEMPFNSVWEFYLIKEEALYNFSSKVIGFHHDNIALVEVAYPNRIHRQQRRRYFRFPCNLEVEYWIIDEEEKAAGYLSPLELGSLMNHWQRLAMRGRGNEKKHLQEAGILRKGYSGFTVDISGGGLQLVTTQEVAGGARVLLCIDLEEGESIMVEGKVARVDDIGEGAWQKKRLGVEFTNISERNQDQIIGFIFREMRHRM